MMGQHLVLLLLFIGIIIHRCQSIDCPAKSERLCTARGCQWLSSCVFDDQLVAGYDVVSIVSRTEYRLELALIRRESPSLFGGDAHHLTAIFESLFAADGSLKHHSLRVHFQPTNVSSSNDDEELDQIEFHPAHTRYTVVVQRQPFGFRVESGATTLIDSINLPGFTHSSQFIQMSFRLATDRVYGFGEQFHETLIRQFDGRHLSLFARDSSPGPNMNLYGFHPFMLALDANHRSFGVYLRNTHGIDVIMEAPKTITYRAIGGPLDFILFVDRHRPDDIIADYTELIGRPVMPPLWGLGYQLCRYGYANVSALVNVYDRNRRARIPQDVQYIDIDYMDAFRDFTYDRQRFGALPTFIRDRLHAESRRLVLIVDPGISANVSDYYRPLASGLAINVFIGNEHPLRARVWPGDCHFPDFVSHPDVGNWWRDNIMEFHREIAFDGIWLDMNDPSNMVDGSVTGCANNSFNYPPYLPVTYSPLFKYTICLDARHYDGTAHYRYHNIYAHHEARHTHRALVDLFPRHRPFVLTRSSAPGTGAYAAHWMGDTMSDWTSMRQSIIAMLEFNMFGIPWSGSDICGFNLDTTEELCLRWSQLGAFYPFARNHNDRMNTVDQDPAAWPKNTTAAIRSALLIRYALLPYLYTLFHRAHTAGVTVARAMFFEFPTDPATHSIADQFMWGSALLIAPILEPFSTQRTVYLPPASRWYTMRDWSFDQVYPTGRVNVTIGKDAIGLYVRGGHIIPWQQPAMTTADQWLRHPIRLMVALGGDANSSAYGSLYFDNGDTYPQSDTSGCLIEFVAKSANLMTRARTANCNAPLLLHMVVVAGIRNQNQIKYVLVDGTPIDRANFHLNRMHKTLLIKNLSIDLKQAHKIHWR